MQPHLAPTIGGIFRRAHTNTAAKTAKIKKAG
jgi:hypothetical protein